MNKKLSALCVCALLLLEGCSSGSDVDAEIKLPIYGAAEISYEIATAQYMDISETKTVAATIGYPYASCLTYPAEAQVISYNLVNGAVVSEGDILVVLDSSGLDYEISNQQTIVNAAYTSSLSGGTSEQLQYEIEQSRLEMLQAEKASYTICAPFDGIITSIERVTEGSTVEEGGVCCTISETDKAAVYIDGSDADQFRFGQEVEVKIDGVTYPATVVAAPDTAPSTASVNRAVFDLGEGTLAKIGEENPLAISAGWATVYVTETRTNVLAVPDAAVNSRGTSYYVTIVDGEERYKLDVTIGEQLGGYTEITSGISEGDVVMADGSGVFTSSTGNDEDDGGGQLDWGGEAPPDWDEQ